MKPINMELVTRVTRAMAEVSDDPDSRHHAALRAAVSFGPIVTHGDHMVVVKKLETELNQFREVAQEFVDRCERGEVRSNYTYAKFKALLETK